MNASFSLHSPGNSRCRGLTLVEISLVIGIMLALASVVTYSISSMTNWQKGRTAAESLKAVYVAQKGYLADHPTHDPSHFTQERLLPYLPGRPGAFPEAEDLDGGELQLNFETMPPTWQRSGNDYDPSDKSDDGLWDIGAL